jgi:hypothetical protein
MIALLTMDCQMCLKIDVFVPIAAFIIRANEARPLVNEVVQDRADPNPSGAAGLRRALHGWNP